MVTMHILQKTAAGILGGLMGLLSLCVTALPDGKLHVFILDIGQGDAILLQLPGGEHVLLDGGPDDRVLQELGRFMPFYDKTIDLVILSHPHADHVNGLVEVLKRYRVRQVMMSGATYHYPGYEAFLEAIAERHVPVVYAGIKDNRGVLQDYALGPVILDMLFPFESEQGKNFVNQNNGSLVLRVLYGEKSFYFSGDLEIEGETRLVNSGLNLHADFYKAGHHGSHTSSSPALLDRIRPFYGAISCGVNNKFHHPHSETMNHFRERKIRTYRTDLDGTVEAVSDGYRLDVLTLGK